MSKSFKIDLTGQKFGHWTVLGFVVRPETKTSFWLCECDCDKKTKREINGSTLKQDGTFSCGCVRRNNIVTDDFILTNKFNKLQPFEIVRKGATRIFI